MMCSTFFLFFEIYFFGYSWDTHAKAPKELRGTGTFLGTGADTGAIQRYDSKKLGTGTTGIFIKYIFLYIVMNIFFISFLTYVNLQAIMNKKVHPLSLNGR